MVHYHAMRDDLICLCMLIVMSLHIAIMSLEVEVHNINGAH